MTRLQAPLHQLVMTRGMATKKAGGSSTNGRDSAGRRLGIKIFPNQFAKPGSILIRQRGTKFFPGDNVGMGRDHTLFAKLGGIVKYTKKPDNKKRHVVHVILPAM
jgi:large subunit ribosomal protein L27